MSCPFSGKSTTGTCPATGATAPSAVCGAVAKVALRHIVLFKLREDDAAVSTHMDISCFLLHAC